MRFTRMEEQVNLFADIRVVACNQRGSPHPADCHRVFEDLKQWLTQNCTGDFGVNFHPVEHSLAFTPEVMASLVRSKSYRGFGKTVAVRMNVEFEQASDEILWKMKWS